MAIRGTSSFERVGNIEMGSEMGGKSYHCRSKG